MSELGRGDILILLVAGYIAITSLVRLMARRRDYLVKQVQQQVDQLGEQRKLEEENLKKQKKKEAA